MSERGEVGEDDARWLDEYADHLANSAAVKADAFWKEADLGCASRMRAIAARLRFPAPTEVTPEGERTCARCQRKYAPEPVEEWGLCCICTRDLAYARVYGPEWREVTKEAEAPVAWRCEFQRNGAGEWIVGNTHASEAEADFEVRYCVFRGHLARVVPLFAHPLAAPVDRDPENAELRATIATLRDEIAGWEGYKRGIDEALNSGDGSYRP